MHDQTTLINLSHQSYRPIKIAGVSLVKEIVKYYHITQIPESSVLQLSGAIRRLILPSCTNT